MTLFETPCIPLLSDIVKNKYYSHSISQGGERYVPVLLPGHSDEELDFPYAHYHIDIRFCDTKDLRRFGYVDMWGPILTSNFTLDRSSDFKQVFREGIVYLNLQMYNSNPAPMAPVNRIVRPLLSTKVEKIWGEVERQAGCKQLKPGNICPHKGIDLTPFADEKGIAICPGHGLRWDLTTGQLLPRHQVILEQQHEIYKI